MRSLRAALPCSGSMILYMGKHFEPKQFGPKQLGPKHFGPKQFRPKHVDRFEKTKWWQKSVEGGKKNVVGGKMTTIVLFTVEGCMGECQRGCNP